MRRSKSPETEASLSAPSPSKSSESHSSDSKKSEAVSLECSPSNRRSPPASVFSAMAAASSEKWNSWCFFLTKLFDILPLSSATSSQLPTSTICAQTTTTKTTESLTTNSTESYCSGSALPEWHQLPITPMGSPTTTASSPAAGDFPPEEDVQINLETVPSSTGSSTMTSTSPSTTTSKSASELPPELVEQLLKKLSSTDLASATLVSRFLDALGLVEIV